MGWRVSVDHVDVLIVGAGLSGIGAACHLRRYCPGKTFTILEARDTSGGTWDLFRYPGIRSDSDMFTLGYSFRPWTRPESIAGGAAIRDYLRDTAREFGVDRQIRFRHRVLAIAWSSAQARWRVTARREDTAETVELTCAFVYSCTGYYRYDKGYTPALPGVERFAGRIVHPQHWPEELDYAGRRIAVIGSGATAVTLVPALAQRAAQVTMVQRSPSYVLTLPGRDALADLLRRWLPGRSGPAAARWKNALMGTLTYQVARRTPGLAKRLLRRGVAAQLPAGFDLDRHFTPRYQPWDQRLCIAADGDLFAAIRSGRVSIETDRIDTFTEKGLRLASGKEIEAEIVVTATGLNILALGGMAVTVDGRGMDLGQTVAYKGMMLSGLPNFAMTVGYTNASWTLKADLVSRHVCRLLTYMDRHGYRVCTPVPPRTADLVPLINLAAGYVLRSVDQLPKQGPRPPWRLYQNYARDVLLLRHRPVAGSGLRFDRAPGRVPSTGNPVG
jgi:monooxygenase